MNIKVVVPIDKAEEEVNTLLDKKKIFPKRREQLQIAIDTVAEAISYGYVTIDEEGAIQQKLVSPVGELTELKYQPRVAPDVVNKIIGGLKNDTQTNRNLAYIKLYTGELEATINKLEPTDRTTADSIAFFFQ